ncbi:MAG TPA: hypothetical protein VGA73_18145 [Candidatus Binatia bacterium]
MKRDPSLEWLFYLPDTVGTIEPPQWADMNRTSQVCDSPEAGLWLAILEQALADYRFGTVLERRSAKNWFARKDECFEFICELMGVDPDRVRKAVLK